MNVLLLSNMMLIKVQGHFDMNAPFFAGFAKVVNMGLNRFDTVGVHINKNPRSFMNRDFYNQSTFKL